MTSPSQFRSPPPYAIDSKEYAAELAEVNRVGPRDGAERTDYQTQCTPFWSDDLGTSTPPGHWNMIAQDIARRKQLSVLESARLFALLNIAEADSAIQCWETKYFYNAWRPETALRELDTKVNPAVVANPSFIPNMASPSFPAYTSGHSTFSAAGARTLALYFGTDEIPFQRGLRRPAGRRAPLRPILGRTARGRHEPDLRRHPHDDRQSPGPEGRGLHRRVDPSPTSSCPSLHLLPLLPHRKGYPSRPPFSALSALLARAGPAYVASALEPRLPGPQGAKPVQLLSPAETGVTQGNDYSDPTMWGTRFRELTLGAVEDRPRGRRLLR